jgi:hypothetical protein
MKKTHYGIIETEGEMQTVVDERAICGTVGEISVCDDSYWVTCKKCLKLITTQNSQSDS